MPYATWIGCSSMAYKLRYVRHIDKSTARQIAMRLITGDYDC